MTLTIAAEPYEFVCEPAATALLVLDMQRRPWVSLCHRSRYVNRASTHQTGRQHETLLTAGQTAGGITEILSVAEIMRRLIAEAEAALSRTCRTS